MAFLYTITDLSRRGDIQDKTCGYGLTVKTGALLRWLERISFFLVHVHGSTSMLVFSAALSFLLWCTYVLIVLCLRQVVSTCRPLLPRTVSTAYCLSGPSCANVFRCIVSCLHNSAINLVFLMYRLVFRFHTVRHMLSLKGEDFKLTVNDIHILAPQYLFFFWGNSCPLCPPWNVFRLLYNNSYFLDSRTDDFVVVIIIVWCFFVALSCRAMAL